MCAAPTRMFANGRAGWRRYTSASCAGAAPVSTFLSSDMAKPWAQYRTPCGARWTTSRCAENGPFSRTLTITTHSTSCRSRPIRTPFTSTVLLLIKSWVVILFSTNDLIESIGQMYSIVSFFSAPRRLSTEK